MNRHELNWLRVVDHAAKVFSTCSRRQYAAVVLSPDRRVVGWGYNGSPPGLAHCVDGACPRANSNVPHGSPYTPGEGRCIATHAEANALLYSDTSLRRGGTLIVNGPPCYDCTKLIVSSGIAKVVGLVDIAYDFTPCQELFMAADVYFELGKREIL